MSHLSHFPQSTYDVVSPSGELKGSARGLFGEKGLTTEDMSVDIEPGDEVRRKLPTGKEEVFEVLQTSFHEAFHSITANFSIKLRRKGTLPAGTGGHYIQVTGNNARVNIGSTDNSTNTVQIQADDLDRLTIELRQLRAALLARAEAAEHYTAIGQIASAETAAKEGNSAGAVAALSALGSAGKWVLEATKDVAVPVLAELLKSLFR